MSEMLDLDALKYRAPFSHLSNSSIIKSIMRNWDKVSLCMSDAINVRHTNLIQFQILARVEGQNSKYLVNIQRTNIAVFHPDLELCNWTTSLVVMPEAEIPEQYHWTDIRDGVWTKPRDHNLLNFPEIGITHLRELLCWILVVTEIEPSNI